MTTRTKYINIRVLLLGTELIPEKTIKYLGIVATRRQANSCDHVKHIIRKAENSLSALTRTMSNSGGPDETKTKVLCGAVQFIVLYGAPTEMSTAASG